MKSDKQNGDI